MTVIKKTGQTDLNGQYISTVGTKVKVTGSAYWALPDDAYPARVGGRRRMLSHSATFLCDSTSVEVSGDCHKYLSMFEEFLLKSCSSLARLPGLDPLCLILN